MTAKIYKFPKGGEKQGSPEKPAREKRPRGLVEKPPKVLLIVGQDDVRDLLAEALVKAGCEVTSHRLDPRYYPAELLGLFEKGRFDVVIPTNLGIPFVYVPDLVSLAQKFGRGAGIVVISGWVQDDFVAELAKIPRTAFLEAPVKIEELGLKVKELAAEPSGRKENCRGCSFCWRMRRAMPWRSPSSIGLLPVTKGCSMSGAPCRIPASSF